MTPVITFAIGLLLGFRISLMWLSAEEGDDDYDDYEDE